MNTCAVLIAFCLLIPGNPVAGRLPVQDSPRKILTADDFKNGRLIGGSPLEQETFWMQVGGNLAPYRFTLIPDKTVRDKPGAANPSHRVGRIVVSAADSDTILQVIEIYTRADASLFRALFRAVDVNLDGYLDIAVVDEFGAKWGRQKYWLYDAKRSRFITNSLTRELYRIAHNGIEPHPETNEIEVHHFPEQIPRPAKVAERYKIVKGHLLLVGSEEIRDSSGGLRLFFKKRIKGRMKIVSIKQL